VSDRSIADKGTGSSFMVSNPGKRFQFSGAMQEYAFR